MDVPGWLWAATIGGFAVVLLVDLWWVDRRPHAFGPREATRWVIFYIVLALLFAVAMWQMFGAAFAGQFLAGYLTEYSLSVDNLFVFLVIMSSFAVPERHPHRVLLVRVVLVGRVERVVGQFVVVAAVGGHACSGDLKRRLLSRSSARQQRDLRGQLHGTPRPLPRQNCLRRPLSRPSSGARSR